MNSTRRNLQKLISSETLLEATTSSGEDMALLVETLRDIKKLRSKKEFLREVSGLNIDFSPEIFYHLLNIPEIDMIETPTKSGDMERISLKAIRKPNEPVSVSDLNSVLRELNRDLVLLQELIKDEFKKLLLNPDITSERLELCVKLVTSLKKLSEKPGSYLFSPIKAKKIEDEFRNAFPNCFEGRPLRVVLHLVERELAFYARVKAMQDKWTPLEIDFFAILRKTKLSQALENLKETGNLLWNIVYNGQRLRLSLEILGIQFGNAQTLIKNN